MLASVLMALALTTAPSPAQAQAAGRTASARGSWHVVALGRGRWQVSWTSPHRLPIHSDRPQIVDRTGAPIGLSVTAADGRTVRTVVDGAKPAPSTLGVVLSGARLDRVAARANRSTPAATTRRPARAPRTLDADPGVAGPYATTTSDYVRPSVKVPGMRAPIEMVGHVVEPVADAATGPRPLVLFLHGRHEYCYQAVRGRANDDWPCHGAMREIPSQLGYDYVQRLLASQGFTTVSIRVNGINAQDYALADGGASARATLVQRHLDYWTGIAAAHQVDLSRVVLVGHSRGGEGVDRAAIRIPLSAPYRIVGQVLVAPTDFANQTAPDVPTVTLLPYCDGDVSDLQGQRFTDISRDLSSGDTSLKSSVLIEGANHNFFNTEWTPGISKAPSIDDWNGDPDQLCGTKTPARLTAAGQRAVGQAYIAGAAALFTRPASTSSLLPMFDGSHVAVRSAGNAVVLSHALGGDRVIRRPGRDSTLTLANGADSSFCTGSTSGDYRPTLCGSELSDITTPHWPGRGEQPIRTNTFWRLSWTARGQSAGLHLNHALDLRARSLDLRTIVDYRRGPAITIALTDSAGHSAEFTPVDGSTLDSLPAAPNDDFGQPAKLWAQTVRVDPRAAAGTLDLAHVTGVQIIADSNRGQLWVADLAATGGTLPALPATRLPVLSIGSLTVNEGNRSGTTVARVPFRLSRPMERAGHFRVLTADESYRGVHVVAVDLAPGQQTGSIPVGYRANRRDSQYRAITSVVAGASTNVVTDHYVGRLVVLDDDPAPKITISRVHRQVAEGGSAQWKVSLSSATDYDLEVLGTVVRGPGRDLTGADVPPSWLRRHAWRSGTTPTLAALDTHLFAGVRPGVRSIVLSIPIRRDHVEERSEAVTLRIAADGTVGKVVTSTVRVAAS